MHTDDDDVNELSSEENDGAGLINGLGYGVRFRLLLAVDWPSVVLLPPNIGVGLVAKR